MASRLRALKTVAFALWNSNVVKNTSLRTLSIVNSQHNMPLMGQQIRYCSSSNKVKHSNRSQMFYMDINDARAFLSYSLNDNIITLKATFVPIKARSGGYAKLLAEVLLSLIKN